MRRPAALLTVAVSATAAALSPSEQQLVEDVRRDLADPVERPSHVDPALPGTFAELAEPHLLAIEASRTRMGTETDEANATRKAVFAGTKPLSALPKIWSEELAKTSADLDGLLRATRAANGKLPRPWTMYGSFSKDPQPYNFRVLHHAARLAAVRSLLALQSGDPTLARCSCADLLALARDASHSSLFNQMIAASVVEQFEPTCLWVIQRITPAERVELARQLDVIRTGWTPFAATVHEEALFVQLAAFSNALSPEAKAALPKESAMVVGDKEASEWQRVRMSLFGGWARRATLESLTEVSAAVALVPPDADLALERITEPVALLFVDGAASPTNWVGFVRRFRVGQARLIMLQTSAELWGARGKLGHWPATWKEAATAAPLDPRTGLEIKIEPAGPNGVRLVPPSDGERTTDDLSVVLRDP